MDPSPLVSEQVDAGARFVAAFQQYLPVEVAFWLREEGEREWTLYLASDRITDDNFDVAYGEVLRLLGSSPDGWLDPFQVKLSGTDDPLAKTVLDLQRSFPGRVATRLRDRRLGGVDVAEVYVYTLPVAAPG